MTTTRVLSGSLAATVLAAIVFLVWPGLDPGVAAIFLSDHGRFVAQVPVGALARQIFYWLPTAIFVASVLFYALRRAGRAVPWAPTTAGLLFLTFSLALGPGLLVNVILKDHSHRPRPYQVQALGGPDDYRPFWRFDGACSRNCSFVSGESSTAFWTLAPALLVPAPAKAAAIAAALIFGAMTSLLRMAFGGHFLSDTVFAGLLTWLVIIGSWRAVTGVFGRPPDV